MAALTKAKILEAQDLPREELDIPEWGGSVWVRTMTGCERDAWEQSIVSGGKTDLTNIRARMAVKVVVDEKGERLFDDAEAKQLGRKSAPALDRIFAVAQRLNGLSSADVDELEKNSGTSHGDGSPTD